MRAVTEGGSMRGRRTAPMLVALLIVTLLPSYVGAHAERAAEFPDGSGSVPRYRPMVADQRLVVCKDESRSAIMKIDDPKLRAINLRLLGECGFEHIMDAVDALEKAGSTIYVLPGTYMEDPYRDAPKCAEAFEDAQLLTYEEQYSCPYYQNLIPIFGDANPKDDKRRCDAPVCHLQIEGTGDDPEDVVIRGGFTKDGEWAKMNGIRGDRADGLYLKNFTVELFDFNAVYILETDGFVIDELVTRYTDEYGVLTFAVDHGVYKNCEAYGNGDAGLYPGSASDVNSESDKTGPLKRWAVEIDNCSSHHNALGYSGTAGNSVYVHDSKFFKNGAGVTTDSVFPDHPGLPQDHGWFTDNDIYSNNVNYYERYVHTGICDKPPAERGYEKGTVCPAPPIPVGTGVMIAGGNYNFFNDNRIYDNWRYGVMLFSVPAAIRDETDPAKQFDTSHFNVFVENLMGILGNKSLPNGLDIWWDDTGTGNCWQDNSSFKDEGVTDNAMDPRGAPDCDSGGSPGLVFNPYKQVPLVPCAEYDPDDEVNRDPPGCDWFDTPPKP